LRLPLHAVAGRNDLARHVARTLHPRAADLPRAIHAYAFKNDERAFAYALLTRHTRLWLFRAHQGAACGDFLLVDLSCADAARRHVLVVDLKQGRAVREGGTAGYQMRHAEQGVAELAARGVVAPEAAYTVLTGDAEGLLAVFG
ncbi:MAG: hypothetical protein Q8P41_05120, partial [Pseudomonadota bacterium]|nr:hypothetical protein [Pseudomonadota bacterium]